jgi:hypothetical protein
MPYEDLSGGHVIAIAPQTLRWATDQMVETLGPETLKKLKVRAGEHLAALLTTTFLLTPPTGIDAKAGLTCGSTYPAGPVAGRNQRRSSRMA